MSAEINLDRPVRLKSGCKINLCLEITGQRPDGYHTLHSYFLPLSEPHDEIMVSVLAETGTGQPSCHVHASIKDIDQENNTLIKAYKLFAKKIPGTPSLQVDLHKGVPSGAGLGGGSADAAALLNFLNALVRQYGYSGLAHDELLKLAANVGADVPFFIQNLPAWVSGIGEVIQPNIAALEPYKHMHLVLVCPGLHVSTPWAFKEWDNLEKAGANALTTYGRRDSNNSAEAICFFNSLEKPVFATFPKLNEIKTQLFKLGAQHALMSGSGSSIFGLFESQDTALAVSEAFREQGLRVYAQALYTGVSPSW